MSGFDLCACGHWRADHVAKNGPCAASKKHPMRFGPDVTCRCGMFVHVVVDLPKRAKGVRK